MFPSDRFLADMLENTLNEFKNESHDENFLKSNFKIGRGRLLLKFFMNMS